MQEDCSVQTGPAQEDALFCHQYYSITDEHRLSLWAG